MANRCGDYGGRKWNGEPCVKRCNGLCKYHQKGKEQKDQEYQKYLAVIEEMGEDCTTPVNTLCQKLGVVYKTFYGKILNDPGLSAAYEAIKAKREKNRERTIKESYFEMAFGPNGTPTDRVWLTKTQLGWREPPTRLEIKHQDDELLAGFLGIAPEEVVNVLSTLDEDDPN